MQSLNLHSVWQKKFRHDLKASFVGFIKEKNTLFLRVTIDKNPVDYEVQGGFEDMNYSSYQNLYDLIKRNDTV